MNANKIGYICKIQAYFQSVCKKITENKVKKCYI